MAGVHRTPREAALSLRLKCTSLLHPRFPEIAKHCLKKMVDPPIDRIVNGRASAHSANLQNSAEQIAPSALKFAGQFDKKMR